MAIRRVPQRGPSPLRVVLQILATVGGVVLGVVVLQRIAHVLVALIGAAIFAYLIAPAVRLAEHPVHVRRRRVQLPRPFAIALVYLTLAAVAVVGSAVLLPSLVQQAGDVMTGLPSYAQAAMKWELGWTRAYEGLRIPAEVRQRMNTSLTAVGETMATAAEDAIRSVAGAASSLPWLLVIPVLAFFLLRDAGRIATTIIITLPRRWRARSRLLFQDLNTMLAAYIRSLVLACLLVGTICGVAFAIIGVPYAVLLGVMAGLLEFIPLVGPFIVAVTAGTVGALQTSGTAYWTIGFLLLLRVVQDYVIYPRLIGRGLELHPLAVILGVMAGAELDGIAGMFLAVPAIASMTVIWRHWLLWHRSRAASTSRPGRPAATPESPSR